MSLHPQDPDIGRVIGSYQITGLLGSGGMGKVFKAKHLKIGKEIAIKLLNKEHSADADSVARFFREARVVNEIHHENIIDTLDFGQTPEGESYLLMELLQGRSLTDALRTTSNAPMPPKRLGHIALQICSALHAAHQKNIIHRDIKTDNIFLLTRANQKDFVKVLDFGIARVAKEDASVATNTGTVLGTPLYISPEQALGQKVGPQSDIYSLGVMLYLMATGAAPFHDPNPISLAMLHVLMKPTPPKEKVSSIEDKLNDTILRCLEKKLPDRYASMWELAVDLGEACGMDPAPYFGLEVDKTSRQKPVVAVEPQADNSGSLSRRLPLSKKNALWVVLSLLGLMVLGVSWIALSKEEVQPPAASVSVTLQEEPAPATQTTLAEAKAASTLPATQEAQAAESQPTLKVEKSKKKKAKEEDFDKVILGP